MSTIASTADVIRTHAKERGDKVAIVQDEHRQTWSELDRRSNRVANALAAAGVGPEDRVAFIDKNGYEYFEVFFGCAKLNAVTVNVNWRLAPPEVAWIVNDAEAKVFFFGQEFADTVAAIRDDLTSTTTFVCLGEDDRFESYETWMGDDDSDPGVQPTGSDVAFQLYSSGTTGLPKGVMLSNDNLFALLPDASEQWGFSEAMVSMVAMPLFHIGGSGWAMAGMFNGGTSVIVREIDPAAIIDVIGKERITHAFLVPAVFQFMLMMPNVHDGDYSSLEMLVYGASPITEEVLAGSVKTFGCKFAQAYGLTETTGAIVTLPPEDHDVDGPNRHRLRSAGKPNGNVEMKIVDPDTFEEVPTGEVGEIITRSDQNMVGYWRNPEGTEAAYVDGDWFRTGDIGYFDDDGYLYIHDRVKDMIVSGGENVYPAEVENALMKHPGVADVAVIGVPDEKWGEVGKALVVKAEGQDPEPEEIIAFAREQLAGFKVPKSVDFIAEIPRNPTGKMLKKDLRAPYWEGRERNVN
ncbi:fatty acid--CoA ligase [Acidimicrobiia bacterium EGI L10123]|uniref:fatty acid--CoA ligase n=1 Tax=Salinilacustrithrix flava TaxID=2957203 RepID=UPI003D7C1B29|nr:fatty acid--CoA ligase [Acidimicrobiia bacterium EGI L10123]